LQPLAWRVTTPSGLPVCRLGEPPQGQAREARCEQPQDDDPATLAGERMQRARAIGLFACGAESDLHRQQPDEHIVNAPCRQPPRATAASGWTPLPGPRISR
jgi:hypothetical protein